MVMGGRKSQSTRYCSASVYEASINKCFFKNATLASNPTIVSNNYCTIGLIIVNPLAVKTYYSGNINTISAK